MAKKVQLSKKINGVAHQIYPKTVYDVVVDKNGKTLLLDITEINSDLERIEDSIPTKLSDLQGGAEIVIESEIDAKLNDYYTKSEINDKLENIESGSADLDDYYTKFEVDDLLDDVQIKDLSEYAKKSELFSKNYDDLYNKPTIISESRVQELIDQAQFPEGGDIDLKNYYTKGEVDIALASKQNTLKDGINIKTINNRSILGSGNLTIDGGGSSIEIITSSDKTTSPSDENVYSALKVNNEFTRNNEKETIGAQWLFLDLTVFEDHIQSPDYTGNVLGSGWYLGFDNGTNSHLEVDTLKVRKKAIFDTLEIKHVAHVGGEIMLTPAGATIELARKLTSADFEEGGIFEGADFEGAYKDHFICYIKTTDSEGNVIENQFAEDDLVMCKTFNVVKKVDENGNAIVNNTYYWRKCIGVGESYIILSDSDKDAKSDEPKEGDVIVTVGNSDSLKKSDRQNAIVISAYSSDAPSICLYQGIGTPDDKNNNNIYSLRDDIMPVRISPKGNKFTGNFIIENKKDVAGSLVQVLESLISFSVTGLSYNELLGVDAVKDEVERSGDHVIYSLNGDIVKTWQQGDNVAIKLRFDELALQNKTKITISLLDGLLGKFDVNNDGENEQTIEAEDLENPVIKLFLKNGSEFDSDTFRIKITGSENCLPYSIEARSGFDTELRRTGIDIEDGTITLQAGNTLVKTLDGQKTLAKFTEDLISLKLQEGVYTEENGIDVVDSISYDMSTKSSTITLNRGTSTWRTGDVIEVLLEMESYSNTDPKLTLPSYFNPTKITLDTKKFNHEPKAFTVNLNITGTVFMQVDGKVKSAKVYRILKYELKNTGIDIENGTITLLADTTKIIDSDKEKSLAEFTKDQINLSVYDDAIDELTGKVDATSLTLEQGALTIDADKTTIKDSGLTLAQFTKDLANISVYDSIKETLGDNAVSNTLEEKSNKIIYSLNSEITYKWDYEQDLKLIIKFAKTAKDFINSLTITSTFNTILLNNEDINTFIYKDVAWSGRPGQTHTLTLLVEFKPGDMSPTLKSLIETVELRQTIKSGLKRTGIDIESGLITLDADKTVIKDGDDNLSLALFTKDLASISVYETIYNRVDGANAVKGTGTSGSNYQIFSLNKDIINLWKIGDVIEFTLSLTEPLNANQTITVVGINGLSNAIDSKTIPNTLFVNNIAQWTTKLNMSISDIGSLQNPAIRVALSNNSRINCTLTAKCSLKLDLKRTGIDIESGLITLDADKTVIKDGNDSFDIASFTKNLITLYTESEGNAASDTNSYGKASELISGSGVVYYRDYDLKKDIVSKWKKGEIITMSFVIQRLSAGKPTITVTGIGALEGILSTTEIRHTLGTRVIQCSVLCLEDAAHLATSDDLKLRISAGFNNELGNLEIYSKLYGEIKKAGINLNDGTITLNADTTKIKSGEKDIALFTVNSKGVAVLNTEFIDADRIETNKLETEGTIKNSGQKVNYLTVSDDNLTVYNDLAVPKVKIHSGTLNSSGGTETINYKTGLTVFQDEREFELVIAENILAQRSNNYITFSDVKIDLNWTTYGLSDDKSILTYDVVLRGSDSNETSLLRNLTIEPSKTLVRKTITLPSKTLSTNKKYSLIIKFMKLPDGHSISVSPNSGEATINYPQNLSEIASDGYNFLFGDGKYLTARDDGFEIVYGSYGFKVSADGIYVKKPGNLDWVSLFGGIV